MRTGVGLRRGETDGIASRTRGPKRDDIGVVAAPEPRIERVRTLGSGASAVVELGRLLEPFADLPAGSEVAVKTLLPELVSDPAAARALEQEARVARGVHDPSLVRVLHAGRGPEGPYLVLTYVPGRSLRQILVEDGPLPEPLVRSVGAQLAGALAALHGAGFTHGDVKPDNVRLDEDGRAVLLDLGFARRLHAEPGPAPSHAGSLAYLSPERAQGGGASPEADVFALGVVLYELATGVHPFGFVPAEGRARQRAMSAALGSSSGALLVRSIELPGADELLASISRARFVPPSSAFPELSPLFDALAEEVLRRAPGRRPDAAELRRRLAEGEGGAWWRQRIAPETPRQGPVQREGIHLMPLIGRERELDELGRLLQRAREQNASAVVWLSGPQGSGKWRLAGEFAARARASDAPPVVLSARWKEEAEAQPGGLLLVLLRRWLLLPAGTAPAERDRRALRELLPGQLVRPLLDALDPRAEAASEASVPYALAEWLNALARRGPVVAFLDDLHLGGAETLGALAQVTESLAPAPLVLILGVREDLLPNQPGLFDRLRAHLERLDELASHVDFRRIDLGPLSEEEVQALVARMFHHSAPRMRLGQALWRKSHGNPGMIAEILRELLRRGDAAPVGPDTTELLLRVAPDDIPVPRSVDRMIAERFRALDAGDRLWLERLAVVGGRIDPEFLVQAFPPTRRVEVDEVLTRLVRNGWLVARGDRYRFDRPALREAVYRSLSKPRKRALHLAAARGLRPAADRPLSAEDAYHRAFHLRSAGEHAVLLETVLTLTQRLRRRASAQHLLTLARWGLEAVDAQPELADRDHLRLRLLDVATDSADRLGRREEQRRLLDQLIDLDISETERPADGALLYLLHGRYSASTGLFGVARGMFRNALQLATASRDPSLISESQRRLALVQAQIGELDESRKLARRAVASAVGENQKALAHLSLAQTEVLSDRIEEALRHVDRALSELRSSDDPRTGVVAQAHLLRARIWRSAGRPMRALGSASRAVRLAQRSGDRALEAEARARLGGLLLDIDRDQEAEANLRDALLAAEEIEDRRGRTLAELWLGLLLWERDDELAEGSIRRAVELAGEIGFHRAESLGLAIASRIHLLRGELEQADAASERAVALSEHHGAELCDAITVVGTRVLVLRRLDREEDAERTLRRLRERMKKSFRRVSDAVVRRDQRAYSERLLEAVLSPDGPVYPRTPAA